MIKFIYGKSTLTFSPMVCRSALTHEPDCNKAVAAARGVGGRGRALRRACGPARCRRCCLRPPWCPDRCPPRRRASTSSGSTSSGSTSSARTTPERPPVRLLLVLQARVRAARIPGFRGRPLEDRVPNRERPTGQRKAPSPPSSAAGSGSSPTHHEAAVARALCQRVRPGRPCTLPHQHHKVSVRRPGRRPLTPPRGSAVVVVAVGSADSR